MNAIPSFHEVRFPTDLARGALAGPERRTEIVTLGSGYEQRNTRWVHSRRRYNAGYGVKTVDDLHTVIAFFEERRGRLFGFRFRDPLDHKSCLPKMAVSPLDQILGQGDGTTLSFKLSKLYGELATGYVRPIAKPVEGSVRVAVNGVELAAADITVDASTGEVMLSQSALPAVDETVSAGFEFDVPVRFETDSISVNLRAFEAGDIPSIPLMELLA